MKLRTYNEQDALRNAYMSPAGVNIYDMTCPFCNTPDFDDIGLKDHLTGGNCVAFDKTLTVAQFLEHQARDRQQSKEETEKTRKELAEMPRDKFLHLSRELSELLGR